MSKRIASLVFVLAGSLLTGCVVAPYHPPAQVNNAVAGAVAGGLIGAAIGDNRRAAGIGAGIGALIGAGVPTHPVYSGATGMIPSCPPGSHWDGRGCLRVGYAPSNQFQGNMVCGPAALHMSCPSVPIPGTPCRRCQ